MPPAPIVLAHRTLNMYRNPNNLKAMRGDQQMYCFGAYKKNKKRRTVMQELDGIGLKVKTVRSRSSLPPSQFKGVKYLP